MPRKTALDFDPGVLKLFDQYVHGLMPRREFLSSCGRILASASAAEAVLDALSPRFAEAEQIAPSDPRIVSRELELPSPQGNGKVRGYLASPANPSGPLPVVLVVHENRGLNPHIRDIARRLAVENFIAFAPDALFPLGGYPGNEDQARELFGKLDPAKSRADFLAAAVGLRTLPGGNGKVGVVGFCYGGGIANYLATEIPDLAAAVPFYGSQPPAEDVPKIKARLLIQYAGADDRINAGWPAYEAALKAAGVRYEAFVYPGVQHGFNNDTTPRYDAAAAKLAWDRTVQLFGTALAG
jgi:carboxymethylenebutenolidase